MVLDNSRVCAHAHGRLRQRHSKFLGNRYGAPGAKDNEHQTLSARSATPMVRDPRRLRLLESSAIAVKAPPRPEPKAAPKSEPKPKPPAPPREDVQKRLREEAAREQQALNVEREKRDIKEQLQREQAAASARAMAEYAARIRGKIRGNIALPQDIKGNPEAIFNVIQLPTGEVLSVKLKKSSGHQGYDEAVERAILKSSPLPKPDKPSLGRGGWDWRARPPAWRSSSSKTLARSQSSALWATSCCVRGHSPALSSWRCPIHGGASAWIA